MNRIPTALLFACATLALAAWPADASAQYDDWSWDGYDYSDSYGDNEYGTELFGGYDDEDATDDWYYDSYDYGDAYTGIYGDEDGENELEYDADLFGDDEWEYGEGNDFFDPGADYEGYGYDYYYN